MYIVRLAYPPNDGRTHPSIGFWLLSSYFALHAVAVGYYETRLDRVENRVNQLIARVSPQNYKYALARVADTQRRAYVPAEPILGKFWTPFVTLFGADERHEESIDALKDLVVAHKSDLSGIYFGPIDLSFADLRNANLWGATFAPQMQTRWSRFVHTPDVVFGHARWFEPPARFVGPDLRHTLFTNANLTATTIVVPKHVGTAVVVPSSEFLSDPDEEYADRFSNGLAQAYLEDADLPLAYVRLVSDYGRWSPKANSSPRVISAKLFQPRGVNLRNTTTSVEQLLHVATPETYCNSPSPLSATNRYAVDLALHPFDDLGPLLRGRAALVPKPRPPLGLRSRTVFGVVVKDRNAVAFGIGQALSA